MQQILERVKQIVLKPRETWEVIQNEETTVTALFKDYLLIVAAVPALASFLGRWLVGYRVPLRFGKVIRLSFGESLLSSILFYVLTIAAVWVVGKVIAFFAPKFGSVQDDVKGMKVSVYTYTPYLAAGVLLLIPALEVLMALAGLYGLYLLYIGLPIVMETEKEKSLPYTVVVIVALILLYIIVGSITAVILGTFGPSIYVGT